MTANSASTTILPLNDVEVSQNELDEARTARIRVKNRRRRYLDLHPEYFTDDSREIADPLLYDRLVRQYMTAQEREAQGKARGFAGTLEADITRSEAKLEALEHPNPEEPLTYVRASDGAITGVEQDVNVRPDNKEDAWSRWADYLTQKFMQGEDEDADYTAIDDNEDYDDFAEDERGRLEQYMNEDDEEYVGEGPPQGETGVQDF